MKKQNQVIRNLSVVAVNNSNRPGFDIYLVFSGHREFLIHHRHNGQLYILLKDGIRFDSLYRMLNNRMFKAKVFHNVVSYLIKVIDDYLKFEHEAACSQKEKRKKEKLNGSREDDYELWVA